MARKCLSKKTIKKLIVLPLEYMHIDGWIITIADTINVAKNNTNIKHCSFAPDEDMTITLDSINYYDKFKCMSAQDLANEMPSIINANPNIESLYFFYDSAEKKNELL